ncbi:MAG: Translation initiation factor 1, partial [uncultured Quadrisphaera sp.]
GQEGRRHRDRGCGRRSPAERDVPGRALQRPQGPRAHLRQDAAALHPHPARGPRGGGAEPVRPLARPDRLPLQV